MTFERALSLMRKGYKVKIKDWNVYYYLEDNKIQHDYIKTPKLTECLPGFIGWFEVMSDEWEIYNG